MQSLDLSNVEGMAELFTQTALLSRYPYAYTEPGITLWYALACSLHKPEIFVYYHFNDFKHRCPMCALELRDVAWRITKLKKKSNYIIVLEGPKNGEFWNNPFVVNYLFGRGPSQFGFRGDMPLWYKLEKYLYNKRLAYDETELPQQIYDAIEAITGNTIEPGKSFYVPEFNQGGMSGGMVSSDFWLTRGMDFLVSRHRALQRVWRQLNSGA